MIALTALSGALFFSYYVRFVRPRDGTLEWISRAVTRPRFRFEFKFHPMARVDIAPLAIILALFSFISFFKLGDFTAPQTFYRFTEARDSTIITLPEGTSVTKVMFYTGLWIGDYRLEHSQDGLNWVELPSALPDKHPTAMGQSHADLFKWRTADMLNILAFDARFIRLTMVKSQNDSKPLELGELAIYDWDGKLVTPVDGAKELFDEQELIPERSTYMNSMYFDEIYHGRTAYETVRNIYPYETVHPPLGKTIISIGIELFHMTPFGWRVMGTAFGVAMLAALYVLIKNMFGKTSVALCGTLLLGFDFMRFTQTRIATVDTYPVFFIILAYLFMYRFLTTEGDGDWRANMRPLFLSGLFFGVGAATKWIVIYAGFGLLVMYIAKLVADYKYCYEDGSPGVYSLRVVKTLAVTAAFFIVIPVIIYILSYIPFGRAKDMTVRGGMLWNVDYYRMIWNVQVNTFRYHSGLQATHPYSSTWLQWIADARPILYYTDRPAEGMKSTFSAFGNPLVWWFGFAAIVAMFVRVFRFKDAKALIIIIGYLSQLVPWMSISRVVFAYHYFPSTIFLVLALAHLFSTCVERGGREGRRTMIGFTASAGVLFALFYPVLSGMVVPESYIKGVLKWFPSWPL
jgi:hypothetical protein